MSTEEAKQANAHVFSQNELALLIIGLRGTIVIKGVNLMMIQNRLLEQFKKELLDRFGTYLEDLDAEDLEFEAEIFFGGARAQPPASVRSRRPVSISSRARAMPRTTTRPSG